MLVVNGHPDPRPERFCAAVCEAYSRGARGIGWRVEQVNVGALGYALFDGEAKDLDGASPEIEQALALVQAADRLMVAFPLWLDRAPPALENFLREATRRGLGQDSAAQRPSAKCGRMVVTMQMPAFIYRPRRIADELGSKCGMTLPLATRKSDPLTFIGSIDSLSDSQRATWLEKIRAFGEHDC